jgi:dihydropteroate synthase
MSFSLIWQTTRFTLDLTQPRVMGIVNLTPDSFSDGGRFNEVKAAVAHCEQLLSEGADILDLGGESSRPGAASVDEAQEWRRVQPVIQEIVGWGCPISLDTTKPGVMRRALDLGVDIINDIRALQSPGAVDAVAAARCGVCLMHMQGQPETMQIQPGYDDVIADVARFLQGRAQVVQASGVAASRIVLDPGIGFGKSVEHNFALLQHQQQLLALGFPLLAGWSRKSALGAVTGREASQRMPASVAAALAAVLHGARVVRVHDVAATVDALKVWRAAGLPQSNVQ